VVPWPAAELGRGCGAWPVAEQGSDSDGRRPAEQGHGGGTWDHGGTRKRWQGLAEQGHDGDFF
jgi:hypothetical protein